ncbi:MAG: hypothetical protein K2W82_08220 [Candidatus Obscuribacterales bacterium]|nr:hypothetical protein [Candidatus Obscuribacterales bacterium]
MSKNRMLLILVMLLVLFDRGASAIAGEIKAAEHVHRFLAPDAGFAEYWKFELNPPIMVEYGMGPNGAAMGKANIECRLWKFGDLLFGSGGYTYSDCGLYKGGSIEGHLKGGKLTLKMSGSLNLEFDAVASSSVGPFQGQIILKDQGTSSNRQAVFLQSAASEDPRALSWRSKMRSIPFNKNYWNALTVSPGIHGKPSPYELCLVSQTLELVNAEAKYAKNSEQVLREVEELASLHFSGWKITREDFGMNNLACMAHASIADALYRRLLANQAAPKQYVVKNYVEFLLASGRNAEAQSVRNRFIR